MQSQGSVFIYSVLRFLPLLISTGGTLLLALSLGIEQFGAYSAALAMTQVVTSIGLIGQEQLVLQGQLRLGAALRRTAITVSLTGAIALVLGLLLLDESLHGVVVPVVISAMLIQACSILFAFLLLWSAARQRASAELGLRLSYQTGLNSGALVTGSGLGTGLWGLGGSIIGTTIVAFTAVRRRPPRDSEAVAVRNAPWTSGLMFGLDGTLYSLGLTVPVLVIAATQPETVNAQARIVLLCYTALLSISRSFTGEIYRVHLYQAREPEHRRVLWSSLRKTLLVYGAAATIGLALASILLPVVLGPDYQEATLAIAILAAGALIQFSGYGMSALAVTNGFIRVSILRNAMTLATSVTLSLLLELGPVQLALIFVLNDILTTVFFVIARRTWGVTPATVSS